MLNYPLRSSSMRLSIAACKKVARPVVSTAATLRGYHTYPDPDEAPIISTARSDAKNGTSKTGEEFRSMSLRYDINKAFGIPKDMRAIPLTKQPRTEITKLANGLTIATQDMPGMMCSMALLVKTGSTAEIQTGDDSDNTGTVQMIELTAFGDTPTRTREEIHASVEQLGGIVQCVAQRESISYFMDVFKTKMDESLDILADAVLNASLSENEVEAAKGDLMFMREMLQPEFISKDAVVMAAYRNQPLGNYHYCPPEKIEKISSAKLIDFKRKFVVPENCIISASAVDHESFVRSVERAFSKFPFASAPNTPNAPVSCSVYTGGMFVEQRTLREEFVRCTIAFEVGGWTSEQFVTTCVLQMLLGGGSSFSAGGPGKGMYTRLYREVLNKYGWVESAESFISCHRDCGLLGIDGSCRVDSVVAIIQVIIDQFIQLTVKEVTAVELSRAKNMLKSMMFTQLESRLVTCEDICKQILVYNERKDANKLCAEIDNVSAQDILNLARSMLQFDPAVAIVGHDVSTAPTYKTIQHFTKAYKAEVWAKNNIA